MCECEHMRSSESFAGWNAYDDFSKIIKNSPQFLSIPVKVPYSTVRLNEDWHQCVSCHSVWRLVEPDPLFSGLWKKVLVINSN